MNKKRYYGIFSLRDKLLSSIDGESKKRHFYNDNILLFWNDIVGKEYVNKIFPCYVSYGATRNKNITTKTLYCGTKDRVFLSEFIFHRKSILDRLNLYFGEDKSMFEDIKLKLIS